MAARGVSRLSESSESASDDPPPPPSPPRKVKAKQPKEKGNAAEELDIKFCARYTVDDPGYAETIASAGMPPPAITNYQGRSFRDNSRGGGGRGGGGYSRGYNR